MVHSYCLPTFCSQGNRQVVNILGVIEIVCAFSYCDIGRKGKKGVDKGHHHQQNGEITESLEEYPIGDPKIFYIFWSR